MDTIKKGKIIIAGDLFPIPENTKAFIDGNTELLFGDKICRLFSDADLAVCNMEGALTDHSERCQKTGPVKVASSNAVKAYKKLGINCCMLANNHATDGGHQGLLDTMAALENENIAYIGAGKNKNAIIKSFVQEIGGMTIGLYNVSETMYNKPTDNEAGAWLYDEYIVCQEIAHLREKCDYVIVIYHGGIEKFPYPSPETRKRFHRMADNGANIILSQHTHCIGSEEYYHGAYLLYGQGDFLLKNFSPGLTDTGLIIELDIDNGQVSIKKHKVESEKNCFVRYSDNQELNDFLMRSSCLNNEKYVEDEFRKFCRGELRLYLSAFKSPGKYWRWIRGHFPKKYRKWLFHKAYNRRDLMFTLHTLRSEQNRETAIIGIEDLLDQWT